MSDISEKTVARPGGRPASVFLTVIGITFTAVWILGHVAWGTMALMANVMANDSGRVSTDQHTTLILGVIAGQILSGIAGVPAGLAFFWRKRRKPLLVIFAALFLIGTLCQGRAFYSFFSAPS